MNKNVIAFKKGKIVMPTDYGNDNRKDVTHVQHTLMSYGYMLTEDAFLKLSNCSILDITNFEVDIRTYLQDIMGDVKAKPLNELLHRLGKDIYTSYQSYYDLLWSGEEVPDMTEKYEHTVFKKISPIDIYGFKQIFADLVSISTLLTPTDFKTVEWFAKEYGDDNIMPLNIPIKENLCMLASLGLDLPVKTPTDVLRIAFYMSTGKADLVLEPKEVRASAWGRIMKKNPDKKNTFFKKFKRKERRYLLGLLDKVANVQEMVLKKEMWLRLGEIIHPGEYKQFANSYKAFSALRNKKVMSWYGAVDKAFKSGFENGLKVLSNRPGEFARRLDALLRNNPKHQTMVLISFKKVGHKVSSKVLWELYTHFSTRDTRASIRTVFIPGARMPTNLPILEPMDEELVDDVQKIIWQIFKDKFSKMAPLGAVYIDPELKKVPLPTNMKTLEDSMVVTVRGTRMPIEAEKKIIRFYVSWKAGVDLDLSMSFVNADNNKTTQCSYTATKPHESISHSGDVIPRFKGEWAEFIDVKIKDIPYKYGLMSVHNFGGGTMETVGARVGFMERDRVTPSKSWYPESTTNSIKVSSKGSNVELFIVDFETREWILVDMERVGRPMVNAEDVLKYVKSICEPPKISVYDLLKLHTEARGKMVDEIENADKVFTFAEFSTSYELTAKYML